MRTTGELEAALDDFRAAPADVGTVGLIVRRPAVDERELVHEAELDTAVGLVGDTWSVRPSKSTPDGSADLDKQLTIMNDRVATFLADGGDRSQAGDQVYVDLDISHTNLPAGTRLALGSAVVEVTDSPHLGCAKFSARFGVEALRFVNSPVGRELRLRGLNAKVVESGTFRRGDQITVHRPAPAAAEL